MRADKRPCCSGIRRVRIKTPKKGISFPRRLADYAKIQLDCGVPLTGMIGVLCYETMEEIYGKRH